MNIDTPIDRSKEFYSPVKDESCTSLWRAVFHRAYNDATTPVPPYSVLQHMRIREIHSARALFLKSGFRDDLEMICDLADIDMPLRRDVRDAIMSATAADGSHMIDVPAKKCLLSSVE
ncbi:MAG: hypothetical protein ACT6RJ_23820 [Niveispirillum sp.]